VPRGEEEVRLYDAENHRPDTAATVDFLAGLAGGGDVLEFGAGTGRLLLPLAPRCRRAVGVDLSPEMVARLESLAPGNVEAHLGDVRSWTTPDRFALVVCAYNLLMEITSQAGQLEAVLNAANLVAPQGHLVIENLHPPLQSISAGRRVVPLDLPEIDFGLVVQTFEWRTQMLDQRTLLVHDGAARSRRLLLRMVFPAEQDLMARTGGLKLVRRLANWRGGPWHSDGVISETANVISVYGR
jgi:SAM-dependent methyltransferase